MSDKTYRKRLPDFAPYDEIRMRVVPRFKQSELSGDEWRTSVAIEFYFKGVLVAEDSSSDMKYAMLRLGSIHTKLCEPIEEKVIQVEKDRCDQPGCLARWSKRYELIRKFSARGERLDPTDETYAEHRQFCIEHCERGDASREDCDENYRRLEGKV